MDGYVIIGTELDTKQLEQDLKNAKKELTQFQKEEERLLKEKGKVELQLSAYDEEKAKIKANTDEMLKKAETETQVNNLLNMENIELDKLTQKYSKQFTSLDGINDKLKDNQLQQGLINGKIDEANTKLTQARGYENVKNQMVKISDKTSDVIKKVGRWALAVFSVRSAYMLVRQVSSTLAQYDEQYASNLEYIRFVLAQAIAPVLQFLVNLAFKLLTYINYIAQAWFGINLFSNASVKNFQKMAGSAESIKKSLQTAGFDEMNVLSDTSNSSGAGGGIPSMDLSQMQGEVPSWLQWIADNKDLILAVIVGIASGLLAIHFGLKLIKGLGIGVMVAGIILIIQSLLDYLESPTWENFGKIIQGVGVAIVGLGILIGSVPLAVAGAGILILGIITKYWQQIKNFFQGGIDWLSGKSDFVHEMFGDVIGGIYDMFVDNLQNILNYFNIVFTSIKGILDGIIMFVKGVFTGDWQMAWEGIKNIFENVWNAIKASFMLVFNTIKNLVVTIATTTGNIIASAFKGVVNAVLRSIENILNSPIRAINGLISVINAVPRNKFRKIINI